MRNEDWKSYFDRQHEAYLLATGITPAQHLESQKFDNNDTRTRTNQKRKADTKVSN